MKPSEVKQGIPEILPFNRVQRIARRWGVTGKVVRDAIKSGRLDAFQPNEGMYLVTGESVERAERTAQREAAG